MSVILLASNYLVWKEVLKHETDPDLTIYFFNVGQGDSAFIISKDGAQILIDGGPNSSVLSLLGNIMPFYDDSIDVVVLSHPHRDHLAGLIDVFRRYKIDMFIDSGVLYESAEVNEFWQVLEKENSQKNIIDSLSFLRFGDGMELSFIYPDTSFNGRNVKDVNETSVTLILNYKGKKVMFTGDIGMQTEKKLITSKALSDIDILKVGHKGSKYSSSLEF